MKAVEHMMIENCKRVITDEARREFREDGATCLKGFLTPDQVKLAEDAFNYGVSHPGPSAGTAASAKIDESAGEKFYSDISNMESWNSPEFSHLLRDTPLADAAAAVFGSPDVWFHGEQLFWKEGGHITATPWHQDTAFCVFEGPDLAVAWVSLDPLPRANSLELVRGSHKGPTYNGFRPGAEDRTEPYYDDPSMPRIPDVEAKRNELDILSWEIEPGDVVLFHFGMLHGGAPTAPGLRRRTISLRFFGQQAERVYRPPLPDMGPKMDFTFHFFQSLDELEIGRPILEAKGAHRVRPWPASHSHENL